MKYFPFFLQLEKLPCLIIGGGSVAERKLDLLIKAGADITIVSVDFTDYILELTKTNNIKCITQDYFMYTIVYNMFIWLLNMCETYVKSILIRA